MSGDRPAVVLTCIALVASGANNGLISCPIFNFCCEGCLGLEKLAVTPVEVTEKVTFGPGAG